MHTDADRNARDPPIVSFLERDIQELMQRFPKLTRAEITYTMNDLGPSRQTVERELARLTSLKTPSL